MTIAISPPATALAEARARAGRIMAARLIGGPFAGTKEIGEAHQRQDWKTLGYRSPKEYFAVELGIASPAREPRADSRSVYFIQSDDGPIKIGVAADPSARMRQIQTTSPRPLSILGVIPDIGQAGERELHQRFADAHLHGEWFRPIPELLSYIRVHGAGA